MTKKYWLILVSLILLSGIGITIYFVSGEESPAHVVVEYEKALWQNDKEKIKELADPKEAKIQLDIIDTYNDVKNNDPLKPPSEFVEYKYQDNLYFYFYHAPGAKNYYALFNSNGKWKVLGIQWRKFNEYTNNIPGRSVMEVFYETQK
jgi:hypothetical protein